MGLKIAELLRWKTSIQLKDADNQLILDDKKKPVTVYLRVVGDEDLQNAYKEARVHSAEKRRVLRDETSVEFKDQIEPIRDASREDCMELIKIARTQNFQAEANLGVTRPDDIKLEEIAVDPDAPTLEEQEKLDAAQKAQDKAYNDALEAFVQIKLIELDAEFAQFSIEDVRTVAELEVSNISALTIFLQEVLDYKIIAATFTDKEYTQKAFDSIAEYRSTDSVIKNQISDAYMALELATEDIKN